MTLFHCASLHLSIKDEREYKLPCEEKNLRLAELNIRRKTIGKRENSEVVNKSVLFFLFYYPAQFTGKMTKLTVFPFTPLAVKKQFTHKAAGFKRGARKIERHLYKS